MSEGSSGDAEKARMFQAIAAAMATPAYAPKIPKRVSGKAKKLTGLTPDPSDQLRIAFGLIHAPDMNIAITGAAYIEHRLEHALRACFIDLSTDDDARLFDGKSGGTLGGLASKIRLGHAIGLFGPVTWSDLMLVNDIRNAFAHSLHEVDFAHESIVHDCEKLQMIDDWDMDQFEPEHRAKLRYFFCVTTICGGLLGEEAVVMIKRRHRSLIDVVRSGMTKASQLI